MQNYKRLKRLAAFMAAMLLCASLACALSEGSFPETDESGFLAEGEFIYENKEEGLWRYLSDSLRIEITREYLQDPDVIYLCAHIYTAPGERFRMIPHNVEKRMYQGAYPTTIAKDTGTVLAITSDFAHLRIQQKRVAGIIIRDGQVLSKKTRPSKSTAFPNLDTLALFDDGDMKVFKHNELAAEEYLAMGATDVLAFGPIMIRDGVVNEAALKVYGKYKEPRTGIGMVEPGHYVAILVEGRHKGSAGMSCASLAQLFADKGCPLAFNLDGGKSAGMVFMGKLISQVSEGKKPANRPTAEILGIGHTEASMEE